MDIVKWISVFKKCFTHEWQRHIGHKTMLPRESDSIVNYERSKKERILSSATYHFFLVRAEMFKSHHRYLRTRALRLASLMASFRETVDHLVFLLEQSGLLLQRLTWEMKKGENWNHVLCRRMNNRITSRQQRANAQLSPFPNWIKGQWRIFTFSQLTWHVAITSWREIRLSIRQFNYCQDKYEQTRKINRNVNQRCNVILCQLW